MSVWKDWLALFRSAGERLFVDDVGHFVDSLVVVFWREVEVRYIFEYFA